MSVALVSWAGRIRWCGPGSRILAVSTDVERVALLRDRSEADVKAMMAAVVVWLLGTGLGLSGASEEPRPGAATGVPLVRSARDGAWSDPETWEGGRVPGVGARVQVRAGHTVAY